MKTQALRAHPTATRATRVAAASLLALSALGVGGGTALAKSNNQGDAQSSGSVGAIWTTSESCQDPAAQDQNLYATGDQVHIRGANFAAVSAITWQVAGQPGGASGDANEVVASGSWTTNDVGGFCVDAYVIAADDWGVYTVDVEQGRTKKNDNYHVEPGTEPPADEPPADEPPADESTDETPADETPADETPADETPADETPADETPADETPADESPADETPADETPADETPADETPADETPADETPAEEQDSANSQDTTPETSTVGGSSHSDLNIQAPTVEIPSTPATTAQAPAGETTAPTPVQSVQSAIGFGPGLDLPETDSASETGRGTSTISAFAIGLAVAVGLAIFIAPSRRRTPDATE